MTIINYDNIFAESLHLVWKGNEYYPADDLSNLSLEKLNNLTASTITFHAVNKDADQNDVLFRSCFATLRKFAQSDGFKAFLFKMEDAPKVPNRVRTYKGVIPKAKLEPGTFFEKEVEIRNNLTIILSLVELTNKNLEQVPNHILDHRKAFIVQLPIESLLDPIDVETIAKKYLTSSYDIDYLRLLEYLYNILGRVYRLSREYNDNGFSLDVFYKLNDVTLRETLIRISIEV